MPTYHKDKSGKTLRVDPGTRYHRDGTGPRNSDGAPIRPLSHSDSHPADTSGTKAETVAKDSRDPGMKQDMQA